MTKLLTNSLGDHCCIFMMLFQPGFLYEVYHCAREILWTIPHDAFSVVPSFALKTKVCKLWYGLENFEIFRGIGRRLGCVQHATNVSNSYMYSFVGLADVG